MKRINYLSIILGILLSFFVIGQSAEAEEGYQPQRTTKIHEIIHYPDHIQMYSTYRTHIVSTEAFLETHKDLKLIKKSDHHLFVEKKAETLSPISSIISIMGIKGEEALKVEKASFNPLQGIKPFIQFEIETFKT